MHPQTVRLKLPWSQKEIDPGGRRRFAEPAEAELTPTLDTLYHTYRTEPGRSKRGRDE